MRAETIIALVGGAWLLHKFGPGATKENTRSDSIQARSLDTPVEAIEVAKSGETGPGRWRVRRDTDDATGALLWRWDAVIPGVDKATGYEETEEEAIGAAQSWLLGGVSD